MVQAQTFRFVFRVCKACCVTAPVSDDTVQLGWRRYAALHSCCEAGTQALECKESFKVAKRRHGPGAFKYAVAAAQGSLLEKSC